jgi:MYXO-CTERM domain-containing protein
MLGRIAVIGSSFAAAVAALVAHPSPSDACGCFTPPDPSVPIVQAGERIAFSVENGVVEAHIQIQYSGAAEEFGWLLPLPSIPELQVGTDELFARLIAQTQPRYRLVAEYRGECWFDPSRGGFGGGGGGDAGSGDPSSPPGEGGDPLVLQDSVGPYDYAVLRADSKQPMLDWLQENGYFVPAGTDEVVDAYINPGAYFLALKLRKGNDVGDLQPVVVRYQSDLPMIPIVLTSVAADPDMGIMVWVLGDSRAIPRNYFHTKINDAKLDWLGAAQNYVDVLTDAVNEAAEGQSFVTEYAGTSSIMRDVIAPEWRFGDLEALARLTAAVDYVDFLNANGFPTPPAPPTFQQQYTSQMLNILQKYLPVPSKLAAELGVTPNDYYLNIRYYLEFLSEERPDLFADLDVEFDPTELTRELDERVVGPTRNADALFDKYPYMTRMFTTLSPEEMVKDPVFSFNPDLPELSNEHQGQIIYYCLDERPQGETPAKIITETGFVLRFPNGTDDNPYVARIAMPFSHLTQVLREEGLAQNVTDNTEAIQRALDGERKSGGCRVAPGARGSLPLGAALIGLIGLVALRRRRRTR